ncbi:ATP-binding protein [Desulfonatronum thioautotrophicum]|uniref:ATP-binding protein n=1 Tax=Desulfonatronum thioautotrophicum TaxID=617001 RepID=UPI0009FBAA6A|nr:ATP-binding protein [Desulfonatronum thioautotrophicum]
MFSRWLSFPGDRSCLLVGPRRSGKTTLLRQRFPDFRYVTLDDLDILDWAEKDPKGLVQDLGPTGIIDEIQRHPRLTVAVKYAIDQHQALILMTGSSTLGLLDAAADTLAGRIDIFSLPTLCWGEEVGPPTHSIFTDRSHPVQIKEATRLLDQAMAFGQFPEVLACTDDEKKHQTLTRYKNTYFTRDLMQLSNIENLGGLLGILHNLVHSLGSHLEVSNFAREAGVSHPTAKKYLNALEQAQLTFQLQGYQYGPAKRHIKASKTYFADTGVIHGLGIPVTPGQLLESFVIAELEKRRKLGFIDTERFSYYKSVAGHEIDLVFEAGGVLYAVEVKATSRPDARDVRNLQEFSSPKGLEVRRFLIHTGEDYATLDSVNLVPVTALFRGQ